jgi:hypothetical protein
VRRSVAIAALALLSLTGHLQAQSCLLNIRADTRRAVEAPDTDGVYTTYLGGGTVTLNCGDAIMTGDSAVHFESEGRAEMIGNVSYADTTRTLQADRLTYFEDDDHVVAEGGVHLVRLSSGATLDGPRTSFYREGPGQDRSVATGRPRMTMPPAESGGEPVVIDSDTAEFLGEDEAVSSGNVVIFRSDFGATADSGRFSAAEGWLFGDPVVTSRGFSLSGDSVRTTFRDGDLDSVYALGNASAEGDDLRLQAGEILINAGSEHVEHAWAYGDGRSLAATGRFMIVGDSMEFAFDAGEIDSVAAFGTARAFQMADSLQSDTDLREAQADIGTGADWIAGDSIRGWFEQDNSADLEAASRQMKRLLAQGAARSLFSGVRDSTSNLGRSRNYIRGSVIDILFVAGEASEVAAEQAIGVYVEPTAEGGGGSP